MCRSFYRCVLAMVLFAVAVSTAYAADIAIVDYADEYNKQACLGPLLRDLGENYNDITGQVGRGSLALDGYWVFIICSFATNSKSLHTSLDSNAREIRDFLDKGGVVIELTQADQDQAKIDWLPGGLSAVRTDSDYPQIVILQGAHRIFNTPNKLTAESLSNWKISTGNWTSAWEAFGAHSGFAVLAAKDANGTKPCLLEGMYGKGRILLLSMAPDKMYELGTTSASRVNSKRLMANILEYAEPYIITATAGTGGAIMLSGDVRVAYGTSQTFTIAPATGYRISDVLVDGRSVGAVTTYTFYNVASDHRIEARFEVDEYTITATAGANGSISPSGDVKVKHGLSQTFIIAPATGYHISDVLVDGRSVGAVATYTFYNVASDHRIEARFEVDEYTITATAGANGSISPSGDVRVTYGASKTLTITHATGYHISDVLVDGRSVGAVTTYTFNNVTSDHTIEARFQVDEYTIRATAGANGSISPSGDVKVTYGASQTFAITPVTGYHVSDVLVDGGSVGAVATYAFYNVASDHRIEARFEVSEYVIRATAGANGSISPSGDVKVRYGASQTFIITPVTGCHVSDVLVDGRSVGAVTTYTFPSVTSDHRIEARFKVDEYTIRVTAGANGSISPSGDVGVSHGSSQEFAIEPDPCYHIEDVLVDGRSVGPVTEYTFRNVTSDHRIEARFEINEDNTIEATAGANGSISPSGSVRVRCGASQTFTMTPVTGYHVSDVLVDGRSVGAVDEYTFRNVTSDHRIEARFEINTYTIKATAGANGSISPSGDAKVKHGLSQTFTIKPDGCYHITDVLVDSISVGAVTEYTFENVTSDHTIKAEFAMTEFTITATAEGNGTISPSGVLRYNCGASRQFAITPNRGYFLLELLVDGQPVALATTYLFTNISSDHTIKARFAKDSYEITAAAGANGSISPSGKAQVSFGGRQTFRITPDPCCRLVDVLVDGKSVGAVTEYTFENVKSDHAIEARFEISEYIIKATAGANGSISPSGDVRVKCGASQRFVIMPAAGYYISDVLVDNRSVGAVTEYTFSNVTSAHTIEARFRIRGYIIKASAGANGSISPSGDVGVNHGGSMKFTIAPDPCYHIRDVLVDGRSVGAVTTYTFNNVTSNRTIEARFQVDEYTIAVTAGANGSISPSGNVKVKCGASQRFTITPATGYHVSDVLVDGRSVRAVTEYTFSNVTSAHTIEARFERSGHIIKATAGANGSISPSGDVGVSYGGSMKFTIAPAPCYHIEDVLVDGKSAGAMTTYTFNNVTSAHTIEARFQVDEYTIAVTAAANGSISPSGNVRVKCGASQSFTITPATGYQVSDVLVDGRSVGAKANYTFPSVTSNHTIEARFRIRGYTITATAGANGSISPSGDVVVNHGGSMKFTIAPDPCHHIEDVLVDGKSAGAVTTYTFNNVTSNRTIEARFQVDEYTIAVTAIANGGISPSGNVKVKCGASQRFTITPATGYHVSDVLVDDRSVGAKTTYTFPSVKSDHTIEARFEINVYTITAVAGDHGSVSPSGGTKVNHGGSAKFTIKPDPCYHITDVLVSNASVGAVAEYTFENVTSNQTIEARFAINEYNIRATAGANGSISPSGNVKVKCGASQGFTITPATGYSISDVLVDGKSIGAVPAYTFANVTSDHTITAVIMENRPPALSLNPSGNRQVKEKETLVITASATDPDGDSVTLSVTGSPQNASFDLNTGRFTFTPDYNQSGSYTVTFKADDGVGGVDQERVTITVVDVNRSPALSLNPSGNRQVKENETLYITVSATDPDGDRVTLSAADSPDNASFNPETGRFTFTPDYNQSGSYTVTFKADDGVGGIDQESVTITVVDVNRPPALSLNPSGNQQVKEGETLDITVSASDPDGDGVTLSAASLPQNATFDADFGLFEFTPDYTQAGSYSVTFRADDSKGGVDNEGVAIRVDNVNRPPEVTLQDTQDNETGNINILYTIADDDKDAVSLRCEYRNAGDSEWYEAEVVGETNNITNYSGQVTWNSRKDIPSTGGTDVEFCITPSDAEQGEPGFTKTFRLVNLLGDYDDDMDVDFDDLTLFSKAWYEKDVTKDIGPASGKVPDLVPGFDGKLDFEDLAVFSLMWNWSRRQKPPAAPAFALDNLDSSSTSPIALEATGDSGVHKAAVKAIEPSGIMAVRVIISYNPEEAKALRVSRGDLWNKAGAKSVFLHSLDDECGVLEIQAAVLGADRNADEQLGNTVAFLQFESLVAADVSIQMAFDLRDNLNRVIAEGWTMQRLRFDPVKETMLMQNYPNPFNPETWIPYQLREDASVVISIYTVTGQLVRTLNLGYKQAGYYIDKGKAAYWDGRNRAGEPVASGVYFYTMQVGKFTTIMRKMAIAR